MNFTQFMTSAAGSFVLTGLRYIFFAGLAWLLAYVFFRRRWFYRKIIARWPEGSQMSREILFSVRTMVIFGFVGAATHRAIKHGFGQMYFDLHACSLRWYLASIVLAILLHETYFYWTHRAMHHRRLFKVFHRAHHLSTNPTPWASYSFSVPEAVVQAGIFPLIVLLIPIHPTAFLIFMTWQITFNVLGHTGFEIFPNWLLRTPAGKVLNTSTAHILHHEHFRGHYGLYFNVWDRWMGTNHHDYERRFDEVTSRDPQATPETAAAHAASSQE